MPLAILLTLRPDLVIMTATPYLVHAKDKSDSWPTIHLHGIFWWVGRARERHIEREREMCSRLIETLAFYIIQKNVAQKKDPER